MAAKSIESIWIVLRPWNVLDVDTYSSRRYFAKEASDEGSSTASPSVDALLPPETLK
jgi:hypothetical protein